MPTPLNPAGENGPLNPDLLRVDLEAVALDLAAGQDRREVERLLPEAVLVLGQLGGEGATRRLIDAAPEDLRPLLQARLAEGVGPADPLGAAEILERIPATALSGADSRLLGGVARALYRLGARGAADDRFAQALQGARAVPASVEQVLADHLAVGDAVGGLGVLRVWGGVDRGLLARLLTGLYAQGHLAAGLEAMQGVGDVLDRYVILREALKAPLAARDEAGCLAVVRAAPRVYWEDLLWVAVLAFLDARMPNAAARAAALWQEVDAVGVSAPGALALAGDVEGARAILREKLEEHLALEEGMYINAWVYRELGRSCGWAGDIGGSLAALERVVDLEERLVAQLSAAERAPEVVAEALLCAARGVVASLEGDRSQATAKGRLAVTLARLGRREAARALFGEAVQQAAAIPRSDPEDGRREALEALVRAQLAAGELPGAYDAACRLRTWRHRDPSLRLCGLACARTGDLAGARICLQAMARPASRLSAGIAALAAWLDAGRPDLARQSSAA